MSDDGVFGRVIDNETLEGMPEYQGKTITQADLAKVALDLHASGEYDADYKTYVENLKKEHNGNIMALGMLFNATGADMVLIFDHNYHGHLISKSYPYVIQNGQWGNWIHVESGNSGGSSAGVIYRGKNGGGTKMEWLLTWSIPHDGPNKVYTEISAARHYEHEGNFDDIQNKLTNGGPSSNYENNGCGSNTFIQEGGTAEYISILTLK